MVLDDRTVDQEEGRGQAPSQQDPGRAQDPPRQGDPAVDWVGALVSMWDAIGKPVDEVRLGVYMRQLGSVPLGLLERAVSLAIRDNGSYATVPTVGAIWQALRKVLGNPLDLEVAMLRYCEGLWARANMPLGTGQSEGEVRAELAEVKARWGIG